MVPLHWLWPNKRFFVCRERFSETSLFNSVPTRLEFAYRSHYLQHLEYKTGFKVTLPFINFEIACHSKATRLSGSEFRYFFPLHVSAVLTFCYQRAALFSLTWKMRVACIRMCGVYFARQPQRLFVPAHKRGSAHKADRVNTHIIILVNSVCASNL